MTPILRNSHEHGYKYTTCGTETFTHWTAPGRRRVCDVFTVFVKLDVDLLLTYASDPTYCISFTKRDIINNVYYTVSMKHTHVLPAMQQLYNLSIPAPAEMELSINMDTSAAIEHRYTEERNIYTGRIYAAPQHITPTAHTVVDGVCLALVSARAHGVSHLRFDRYIHDNIGHIIEYMRAPTINSRPYIPHLVALCSNGRTGPLCHN